MNIDELRQILDIVREHGITEFELEREDVKLRVKTNGVEIAPELFAGRPAALLAGPTPAAADARPAAPMAVAAAAPAEAADVTVVKSPIVGTFYRAPEPGARQFVDVGTKVRKGQVLCIIEAMKLMNEITSDYDGEVMAIYVENGQAVQYGERLFGIRRA